MKKITACILSAFIILLFSSCAFTSENVEENTTFYYIRSEYQYYNSDSVIVGEERTFISNTNDIHQLIDLYLTGPVDDSLISPVPRDTELIGIQEYSGLLEIIISDTERTLNEAQFSLACVCLGKTIMEDPKIIQVTIFSGDRSMTISRNNYFLTDEVGATVSSKEVMP